MLKLLACSLCSGLLLAFGVSGCVVTDRGGGPGPAPAAMGTLTTDWTLDGSWSDDVCFYYQVDRVNVVIVDDEGYVIADQEPYCEDFAISFDLPTGWYSTEVTLIEPDGYAVSDTVIVDVRVLRDTETFVDVDFPDSAIF